MRKGKFQVWKSDRGYTVQYGDRYGKIGIINKKYIEEYEKYKKFFNITFEEEKDLDKCIIFKPIFSESEPEFILDKAYYGKENEKDFKDKKSSLEKIGYFKNKETFVIQIEKFFSFNNLKPFKTEKKEFEFKIKFELIKYEEPKILEQIQTKLFDKYFLFTDCICIFNVLEETKSYEYGNNEFKGFKKKDEYKINKKYPIFNNTVYENFEYNRQEWLPVMENNSSLELFWVEEEIYFLEERRSGNDIESYEKKIVVDLKKVREKNPDFLIYVNYDGFYEKYQLLYKNINELVVAKIPFVREATKEEKYNLNI